MDESLQKKIQEATEHVAVKWDDRRARAVERALLKRAERGHSPPTWGRLGYAFAALVVVLGLAGAIAKFSHHGGETSSNIVAPPRSLRLDDGSSIVLASDESSIRTLESTPGSVGVEVVKGSAHFEVTHDPARFFRVVVAGVTVEVIGTAFTVERLAAGARVSVERGRVRVRWSDTTRYLSAGEVGLFGEVDAAADPSLEESSTDDFEDAGVAALAPSAGPGQHMSAGEWRSLAHDGDFAKAYEALRGEGPGAVRDEPNELLLQADVARLSGHPGQAVAPLQRLLSKHANDAQAPLAAFTLGRVLLDELKRPRDAAQAFARVYRLSPSGPLSQDALAREVEAWSRAGEAGIARERALRYVQSYPQGRKLNAVRHYGGLE